MDSSILNALSCIDNILSDGEIINTAIVNTIDTSEHRYLEAFEEAKVEYERIRNDINDVKSISTNIDAEIEEVIRVKEHVFFDSHTKKYGDGRIEYGRLDEDPEIVNAWDRLSQNNHVSSDMDFFRHESYESNLVRAEGMVYNDAHDRTVAAGFTWCPGGE